MRKVNEDADADVWVAADADVNGMNGRCRCR